MVREGRKGCLPNSCLRGRHTAPQCSKSLELGPSRNWALRLPDFASLGASKPHRCSKLDCTRRSPFGACSCACARVAEQVIPLSVGKGWVQNTALQVASPGRPRLARAHCELQAKLQLTQAFWRIMHLKQGHDHPWSPCLNGLKCPSQVEAQAGA